MVAMTQLLDVILLALNFVVPVVVCKDRANSNLSLRKTGTVYSEFYERISAGQPCNRTVDNSGTIIKIGLIVVETIYLFMREANEWDESNGSTHSTRRAL